MSNNMMMMVPVIVIVVAGLVFLGVRQHRRGSRRDGGQQARRGR